MSITECAGRRSGRGRAAATCLVLAVLLAAAAAMAASAQTKPATRPAVSTDIASALPTAETLQATITRLEQAKDPEEAIRKQAIDACKQALAQLAVVADWKAKAAAFDVAAKEAPAKLAAVKEQLTVAASQPATTMPADAAVTQFEQLAVKADADLVAAKKAQADTEAEPKRRAERRLEVPKLLSAAQKRLDEITRQLAEPPTEKSPELTAANRALLAMQREAVQREIEAHQKELLSYDAERDLLTTRRDLAARQAGQAEKFSKDLQDLLAKKRKSEADRLAAEAREAAERAVKAHSVVRKLAEENAILAEERTGPDGLVNKIDRVSKRLDEITAEMDRLTQGYKGLLEKAKAIGKTATFGVLLRKQKADLPDIRLYGQRAATRQAETVRAQLRLIELEDARSALADPAERLAAIAGSLKRTLPQAQREKVLATAKALLEDRSATLDALIKEYDTYFTKLIDLAAKNAALIAKTDEVSDYINERVLWIRSAPPLALTDFVKAAETGRELLGPEAWARVGAALWDDFRASPVLDAAGILVLVLLAAFRGRLKARLTAVGQPGAGGRHHSFLPTLVALGLTFLLAATLPALLAFLAWRISVTAPAAVAARSAVLGAATMVVANPARAIAAGLGTAAAVLMTFGAVLEITRPKGLAEAHFGWRQGSLTVLRRGLRILGYLLAALAFGGSAAEWQASSAGRDPMGRLTLIASLLAMAVFAQRVLRPSGAFVSELIARWRSAWLYRLRQVAYVAAMAVPVLLTVLAGLGSYYTALHLVGRLTATLWLVLGLALLNGIGARWLAVAFRKLALRRLRAKSDAQPPQTEDGESDRPPAEEPQADLGAINAQTRRLLRYVVLIALVLGTWGIWAESLPALAGVGRARLWTHTVTTSREAAAAEAAGGEQQAVEKLVPITLADVLSAVLAVVLTVIAARNIPGLLEIIVLQRLDVDSGIRYATAAIVRYIIAVTGVIVAFQLIGVGWSSVQWLIAAMTVGLAFGLQEIFANFVSGLIILFERPIRIGDTVTIGDMAGTVTRIRIRATTITDWDRKELIVPNKEFVTGRLINWTLSDKVLRVVLRVGVAYGSDTELAEKLLHEKACEHPLVLKDPKPVVLFKEFGDNSLNFELRVYISGIEHYVKVWHALNMAIDKAFRKAGITIAFPQRDIHLDTLEPLEVRILPAAEVRRQDPAESPAGPDAGPTHA
ncbi:MAG TPA: mechanosensitive ion channel domain-containing protein [Phycisphaerae bacterium]|nr:mechanosensitive ion channel domain-containing protein [Phycisphaerae bacterium]